MNPFKLRKVLCLSAILLCLCACQPLSTEGGGGTQEPAEPVLAMSEDGVHPQLIAHGGGAVYGYRLTNSLEALNHSYDEGFRFIEVDLNETSDGRIALIHDWIGTAKRLLGEEGVRTAAELHSAETMAGLTFLTLNDLLIWLDEHPDCTIVTDIKQDNNCQLLQQLANESGDQIGRFIPQAYTFEEYDQIKKLGYDQVILTLYRITATPEELLDFEEDKDPWAITIPEEQLGQYLPALTGKGIATYAHSVNTVDTLDQWHEMGLTGIYTDYFLPSHWIYEN